MQTDKMTPAQLRIESSKLCDYAETLFNGMYMGNPENDMIAAMIDHTYAEAAELDRFADAIESRKED